MLVVSRKRDQDIVINVTEPCQIRIKLVDIRGEKVRLGLTGPRTAEFIRDELLTPEQAAFKP